MTDVENTGVNEEVAAPIAEEVGDAQAQVEQPEVQAEVQETDQEMNFRRLRESNEQLQRDRDQDRQMMMALQQEVLKRGETPPVVEKDEFENVDESDWSTIAQTKKMAERVADERFDKKWSEAEAKRKKEEAPQRIKQRFQDFDAVVTEENVKQLRVLEPEVAQALSLIGDEEAKAVAAYKYIKMFIPTAVSNAESKQRIQQNAKQPKSLSSTGGNSPLSQAGAFEKGLTPDLKKQLFAEMQAFARQS